MDRTFAALNDCCETESCLNPIGILDLQRLLFVGTTNRPGTAEDAVTDPAVVERQIRAARPAGSGGAGVGWGGRNWDSLVREAAETVAHAPQVRRNRVPRNSSVCPWSAGSGKESSDRYRGYDFDQQLVG